ncbi:hypothetical protein HC776_03595 [bacterium]|nr:hypothetical protein [bacterium]
MDSSILFYMLLIPVLVGFLRAVLIVSGVYKAPILRSLEPYGSDQHYSPLVSLVLWGIAIVLMLIWMLLGFQMLVAMILFLSIPIGLAYQHIEIWVERHPRLFLMLPNWYWNLIVSTSRDEQRRLAYMWLRLPVRTQWMYNTHDVLFFQWTDLVLLSMV